MRRDMLQRLKVTAGVATILVAVGSCGGTGQPDRRGTAGPATQTQPQTSTRSLASQGSQTPTTDPPIRRVRADDVVDSLAATLEDGRQQTAQALRAAGLGSVVDDIVRLDGFQVHDLSADALLAEVYRRAEAHTPGQGQRVLAHLYSNVAANYGAVASDPAFHDLRAVVARAAPGTLAPERFQFAGAGPSQLRFPASVDRAVNQLAYVYAQPNLSQLRSLTLMHFQRAGFDFDRIVAESQNSRDAIARMVRRGTPPPSAEEALEGIMRATLDNNGALVAERDFIRSIEELRGELGLDRLDQATRSYVQNEDRLPSRVAQRAEARGASQAAKVDKPNSADVVRVIDNNERTAGSDALRSRRAEQYVDYVYESFEPPADGSAMASGGGGGGGGGGESGRARRTQTGLFNSDRPYSTTPRTAGRFTGSSGGAPRVARSFATAAFSSRAGRGVSVGATVSSAFTDRLLAAAFVPIREDGRFGRMVVHLQTTQGPILAASRTLFADSFYAATSVLWGGHTGLTQFREGEILVLMSMNPFDTVDSESALSLRKRSEALVERASKIPDDDFEGQLGLLTDFMELEAEAEKQPRRTVVHPALIGRELAWSAIRVDFAFNDLSLLNRESTMPSRESMPQELSSLPLDEAHTWQYFERDAMVKLTRANRTGSLSVTSSGPPSLATSERSHFAISMFQFDLASDDDEGRRLPELETAVQPLLDWLSTRHHDFIRLNDFSESFSLLRWVRQQRVGPVLIDMDGEGREIATPDRVMLGKGPMVR